MKVKICGITNLEDALVAVTAGADYLGFIFYAPSKRSIAISTAQEVVSRLRKREDCPLLVGVFVNETAVHMAHILDTVGLDLAQLSGEEVPQLIGDEDSPVYGRAYKALRPSSFVEAEADAEWYVPPENKKQATKNRQQKTDSKKQAAGPSLLIDTFHPTLRGGTGETGDWAMIARLAQTIPGLMLAGGLNPDNVANAVQQVRPFAVDVAGGVESRPGKKDPTLIRAFIHNAKSINNQQSIINH